jgi:hypothetical protein
MVGFSMIINCRSTVRLIKLLMGCLWLEPTARRITRSTSSCRDWEYTAGIIRFRRVCRLPLNLLPLSYTLSSTFSASFSSLGLGIRSNLTASCLLPSIEGKNCLSLLIVCTYNSWSIWNLWECVKNWLSWREKRDYKWSKIIINKKMRTSSVPHLLPLPFHLHPNPSSSETFLPNIVEEATMCSIEWVSASERARRWEWWVELVLESPPWFSVSCVL